jgi:hypothetical protein
MNVYLFTDNSTSQCQPQWTGPSPVDECAMNNRVLNNQQYTIDDGTISVSSQYSQEYVTKNITSCVTTVFFSNPLICYVPSFFYNVEFIEPYVLLIFCHNKSVLTQFTFFCCL